MAIQRIRCEWSGTAVEGPGLTTFYSTGFAVGALPAAASAFFTPLLGRIPSGTTISVPDGGDLIDETNGALIGTWGSSGSTSHNTSGPGSFAAGVGARVVWETDTIRGGRRVRGSTFAVPLTVDSYESNGTLTTALVSDLNSAVSGFMTALAGEGRVWSRPRPALVGAQVPIARGVVPDKVSWLRSRRV